MRSRILFRSLGLAILMSPVSAFAHCDTLDGPVVKAAQAALSNGDVNLVLTWVQPQDEAEIRAAFRRSLEVRKLGGEAQKMADQFFFETLVRVHRAGEGAPFTGLKPAGGDLGPAVPAGDKALETGDLKPLWKLIGEQAHQTLHARFEAASKARAYQPGDVAAGRKYVATYVSYIHYVEGLFATATGSESHGEGAASPSAHAHHD